MSRIPKIKDRTKYDGTDNDSDANRYSSVVSNFQIFKYDFTPHPEILLFFATDLISLTGGHMLFETLHQCPEANIKYMAEVTQLNQVEAAHASLDIADERLGASQCFRAFGLG